MLRLGGAKEAQRRGAAAIVDHLGIVVPDPLSVLRDVGHGQRVAGAKGGLKCEPEPGRVQIVVLPRTEIAEPTGLLNGRSLPLQDRIGADVPLDLLP